MKGDLLLFGIYSIYGPSVRLTAHHTKTHHGIYFSDYFTIYLHIQKGIYDDENFSVAVWEENS